jgi:hypothetical protein
MAPEIRRKECKKRRVTPLYGSIDVYAMGVTLLELFAGSVWMGSGDDDAQVDLEVEQALERVERVEPAVAPIIRSCLATRPAGAHPGRCQPSSVVEVELFLPLARVGSRYALSVRCVRWLVSACAVGGRGALTTGKLERRIAQTDRLRSSC